MEKAHPKSCILLFTDADAKDTYLTQNVIDLAKSKNLRTAFLLRGDCGRRKREISSTDVLYDESTDDCLVPNTVSGSTF